MSPASSNDPVRRILRQRLDAFLREIPGTLKSDDIEYLHRLRVASRRLRVTLESLRGHWTAVRYKKLRDRIRQVTRILGPGRDLDTQIAFLEKFASSKKGAACRPDLARLLRRLSQERSRMQPAIVKVLERTSSRDLADEVLRGLKSHSLKKTGKGLARRTRKNLRKMVSCDRWTGKKRNVPRLHQLRIAAKHLRYSLEDLRLFFPGKFSVFISAARQVQKHLGDMHNYYTWRKNSGKDAPAALDQELGKLQDRAHSCFLRAWRRQKDQRLWKKLRRALP